MSGHMIPTGAVTGVGATTATTTGAVTGVGATSIQYTPTGATSVSITINYCWNYDYCYYHAESF